LFKGQVFQLLSITLDLPKVNFWDFWVWEQFFHIICVSVFFKPLISLQLPSYFWLMCKFTLLRAVITGMFSGLDQKPHTYFIC